MLNAIFLVEVCKDCTFRSCWYLLLAMPRKIFKADTLHAKYSYSGIRSYCPTQANGRLHWATISARTFCGANAHATIVRFWRAGSRLNVTRTASSAVEKAPSDLFQGRYDRWPTQARVWLEAVPRLGRVFLLLARACVRSLGLDLNSSLGSGCVMKKAAPS
jgi:hypothetical protein